MGKHAVRQRNGRGEQRRRKNRGRGVVTASSVSMAGLLAGGLVLAPHTTSAAAAAATAAPRVQEEVSLAATLIFIDGQDYPDSGHRMLTELQGNVEIPDPMRPSAVRREIMKSLPIRQGLVPCPLLLRCVRRGFNKQCQMRPVRHVRH